MQMACVFLGLHGGLAHLQAGVPYTVVIIMIGTNDLGSDHGVEEIVASVAGLHLICHRKGVTTVGISIPPNAFSGARAQYPLLPASGGTAVHFVHFAALSVDS
jgi:hypothetical protein